MIYRLLMIRHAHASEGSPDSKRTLTGRGQVRAHELANSLRAAKIMPQRVLCSPAVRTAATWEIVAADLAGPAAIVVPALYGAGTRDMLDAISQAPNDMACVAVVTHNPGISEFVRGMSDGSADLRRSLSPGDAVLMEIEADSWAEACGGRFEATWRG